MKKLLLLTWLVFFLAAGAGAQTYEIRAVNKGGGYIGVEMRVTSGEAPTTANFITDIVFGLKWQSSYQVDLVNTIATSYNIIKSDVRKTKDSFYYQAFSAANTPFAFPAAWQSNEWVEIMSVRNTLTGRGKGEFTIVEAGFDPTTDPNFGNNLVDYTPVVVASATGVPLPVTLTTFTAAAANNTIRLQWTTASEQNNKGFAVQRSEKETGEFKNIGWVESKGNSSLPQSYEFADKEAVAKVKYYYRLKQVDQNEEYRYSQVRTAMLDEVINNAIRITPNPAAAELQVFFDNIRESGTVVLKIIDAKGVLVYNNSYYISTGSRLKLNVCSLSNGQYFLQMERKGELIYAKTFQKL